VYYDFGIRGSIYRKKLDARVGYDITDTVFVYTGGRSTIRTMDIEASNGKAGEVRDAKYSVVFGIGIR
jgi:hypothetical protein